MYQVSIPKDYKTLKIYFLTENTPQIPPILKTVTQSGWEALHGRGEDSHVPGPDCSAGLCLI